MLLNRMGAVTRRTTLHNELVNFGKKFRKDVRDVGRSPSSYIRYGCSEKDEQETFAKYGQKNAAESQQYRIQSLAQN